MRFWITRNGEVPIREQIARQVLLGIFSEDLSEGQKLPSVRSVARRHRIHANTVSAAYHDLQKLGWLELRRGSGLYVRRRDGQPAGLSAILTSALRSAQRHGYSPDELLEGLARIVRPRVFERIALFEPEPAMRDILLTELRGVGAPVETAIAVPNEAILLVALPTRMASLGDRMPPQLTTVTLRLRSVQDALEGQHLPDPRELFTIVSRSAEIRAWARTILITVGIHGDCINEVDPGASGWEDRARLKSVVITDAFSEAELPGRLAARTFRVIADSSIRELKQLCGV